jgi:GDPmannose 4,6-dehydratase
LRCEGPDSTTRKLTTAVSRIALGKEPCLAVGDLNLTRDWGHAEDAIEVMWLALQAEVPDDYIVASGEGHTMRDLLETAFATLGINVE